MFGWKKKLTELDQSFDDLYHQKKESVMFNFLQGTVLTSWQISQLIFYSPSEVTDLTLNGLNFLPKEQIWEIFQNLKRSTLQTLKISFNPAENGGRFHDKWCDQIISLIESIPTLKTLEIDMGYYLTPINHQILAYTVAEHPNIKKFSIKTALFKAPQEIADNYNDQIIGRVNKIIGFYADAFKFQEIEVKIDFYESLQKKSIDYYFTHTFTACYNSQKSTLRKILERESASKAESNYFVSY